MIRRFYVMPLDPGIPQDKIAEFLTALGDSDRFIAGLIDSSAGFDPASRTVLWEMLFVDEATYSGPYMLHPYHMATLDNYLIGDSPERMAHDIYTVRYLAPEDAPRLAAGIRRIVLMDLPDGADTAVLEAIAARGEGMATSIFSPDNVPFRFSGKGLSWTHIWEQGFTDEAALDAYLQSADGIACSQIEGLRQRGADIAALTIFTCPFALKPPQIPANLPPDTTPILYVITARTASDDADAYVAALERDYDPALAAVGAKLAHRWRSVDLAYGETEIQSTWQLASVAAFHDLRLMTVADPAWHRFVKAGMPLVRSGTRRFYRAA